MLPNPDFPGIVPPVSPPRFAPAVLFLAAIAMAASARATLWVSPGGDDANPGTEEQPLRTIARARDVVRTLNQDMTDDITVFIAGEHHLDGPLEFMPEDSGTNGFNVVYTAAPGEHPVLSGATRVSGWTLADAAKNLWSAPAPAGMADKVDLYVNGNPAARTRARLLARLRNPPAGPRLLHPDPRRTGRIRTMSFSSPRSGVRSGRSARARRSPLSPTHSSCLGHPASGTSTEWRAGFTIRRGKGRT